MKSFSLKSLLVLASVVTLLLFASLFCAAQTTTLYDNFNRRFINPSLWNTSCFSTTLSQECATEIKAGHLRLVRRITGNTDSDTGTQFGSASAFFFNPAAIKSITTDLAVQDIEEAPCAANPGFEGHADIIARFFNAGDGTENDDVGATIFIGRSASDPKGQLTIAGNFFHNNDYSHFIWLGTVQMGTPITATVAWDQANHRFLYSWTNKITHVTTPGMLSYSLSDTTPAADPEKHLDVEIFPANCTATQTWVYTEALFDNVFIGQ